MDTKAARSPRRAVAVVGMAGRFPGAPDLEGFWRVLMGQGGGSPSGPEPGTPPAGGLLDGVEEFDPEFFGIPVDEVRDVHRQQRLMLQESWRALEDAGQPVAALAGTRTGVYIGAPSDDEFSHRAGWCGADVIAASVSSFLQATGPSLTVRTGCSSALVALHLAAQALRAGEIDAAVVGSVHLVPAARTVPESACPGGQPADGAVPVEGVAALYLKTLERALVDGDRIHGVVSRTVVGTDSEPAGGGQRELLRVAYRHETVPLAYLEAHDAGPAEAAAIRDVLGRRRTGAALPVGSVRSAAGEPDAPTGMVGLIKVLLALRHRTVPPSAAGPDATEGAGQAVTVVCEPLPLPATGPLVVGVNSLGNGGTLAHAVLMTGPQPAAGAAPAPADAPVLVPLSAKDPAALAQRAAQLCELAPGPDGSVAALAGALAWRRDHFPFRAAVLAGTAEQLRAGLAVVAEDGAADLDRAGAVTGRAVPKQRTAFVFAGPGPQWRGMGVELYRHSPVFADAVRRCADALRVHLSWDPLAAFTGTGGDAWMFRAELLHPTLWAMSLGLAELWRSAGVTPDLVMGHGEGEIAAATYAGILSYSHGALVVARRGAAVGRTTGWGLMLAVDLDRDAATAVLEGFEDLVSLAIHDGPHSCVLSGDHEAVLTLKELLEVEGVGCRLVDVAHAAHSGQMDGLRDELRAALAPVAPRPGTVGFISAVRAERLAGTELDAEYWVENLRRPVLFADAVRAAFAAGVTHVVEVDPHPVLAPALRRLAAEAAGPRAVLATLHRHAGTPNDFTRALARGYVAGLEPFGGLARGWAPVPPYPLRRDRHPLPGPRRGGGPRRGLDVTLEPSPAQPDTWHGQLDLAVGDLPWLGGHAVHGVPVLPAAAMLTLAVHTARARTGAVPRELRDVEVDADLALGDAPVRLTAEWRDDLSEGGSFRLLALVNGDTAWVPYATARVGYRDDPAAAPAVPVWHTGCPPAPPEEFYSAWAGRGLGYADPVRSLRALYRHPDGGQAVGEVVLHERLRAGPPSGLPHPVLWDGALQVALALVDGEGAEVPASAGRIRLWGPPAAPVTGALAHAVRQSDADVDVFLYDAASGQPLLSVEGLRLRPRPAAAGQPEDAGYLYRIRFVDAADRPAAADAGPPGTCVIVGAPGKFGDLLAEAMAAAGAEVVRATGEGRDLLGGVIRAACVVFVAPPATAGLAAQREGLGRLAAVARAAADLAVRPRLVVLTAAAQVAVADDRAGPGAALYWGFVRVLGREHSELEPRLIDVDPSDPDWAASSAAEIRGAGGDDQIVLRRGRRLTARLTRADAADEPPDLPAPGTGAQPFRVGTTGNGFWEDLACLPLARRPPGPGEVEIEVTASALNFLDVMKVVGTHPGRSAGANLLGGECAGRVIALGPGVTGLALGDRVVACAFGALASHVTVRADHARPIPRWLPDPQAAALPLVTTTAWHALAELARLRPDETVLVHSAAGGVGLAAVAVAQMLGARVIATAGTPAKRAHLGALGVDAVFDSRDLSWVDGVRAATGGRGVDVALNSLTGAAIPLGLEVLAEDGRFVELGKRDIYGGRTVSLAPFRKRVSLTAVDLAGLIECRPGRFAELLGEVWQLVTTGALAPLPVRTFPFAEVTEALREMSHGTHIGKVVVVDPDTVRRVVPVPTPGGRFRADGTYIISGGLGELGLSMAEFLAAHGAGALVLLDRAAMAGAAAGRLAALRAGGTRVEALRCDVRDAAAVRTALDRARPGLAPVRGVVHAAGVPGGCAVRSLSAEQVDLVLGPKVDGAGNLDSATADDPLDFFVLFSSAAALLGDPGQAAAAAADAYLDAFAYARRQRGRPALSVQWGPFAVTGPAQDDAQPMARPAGRGLAAVRTRDAWPALVRMLAGDQPVLAYVPLQLRHWFDANPETAAMPSWARLRAAPGDTPAAGTGNSFLHRLRQAAGPARAELAEAKIRELAARVLRLEPADVESETPLNALGLDSLTALELRNRLESVFDLRLSPTLLWTYGNARALARALCDRLPAAPPGTSRTDRA